MGNLSTKLVLFDIGGVFIEYENVFITASKELGDPREIFDNTFDKYDKEITLGKITPEELFNRCIEEYKLEVDISYNFLDSWISDFTRIQETYDFVTNLSKEYKVGILSNIYKGMVPLMKEKKLIPDIPYSFEFISAEIGVQKPELKIYEYVEKETGYKNSDIFFIDDKKENLDPAIRLGWQVHMFERFNPNLSVEMLERLFS